MLFTLLKLELVIAKNFKQYRNVNVETTSVVAASKVAPNDAIWYLCPCVIPSLRVRALF